jgi:hypothetical protein
MSKKHSVAVSRSSTTFTYRRRADKYQRHIKETCWKACDECCENNRTDCNAHSMEGDCTGCEQAKIPCTKHTEAVADCVPELLTAAPAEPVGALRKPVPVARKQPEKRKATKTPEVSPKAKPKRKSVRVKGSESVYKKEPEDQVEAKITRPGMSPTWGI